MTGRPVRNETYAALNAQLSTRLSECAKGDRAAFTDIYQLTSGKFTAILMKMVRDEAACADIMQKAYLSIWKNADRFDPAKGKAFTWMLVIMRNRALDALRARARYRESETLSGSVIETIQDEGLSPIEGTQAWMIRRLLEPYLSQLNPNMARAVQLSTMEGMSAREIGETLEIPTNTAKSWVRRGLLKIRKDLEQSDDAMSLYDLL